MYWNKYGLAMPILIKLTGDSSIQKNYSLCNMYAIKTDTHSLFQSCDAYYNLTIIELGLILIKMQRKE